MKNEKIRFIFNKIRMKKKVKTEVGQEIHIFKMSFTTFFVDYCMVIIYLYVI